MKYFTQGLRVTGKVSNIDQTNRTFDIVSRGGVFHARLSDTSYCYFIRNSDGLDRDRTEAAQGDMMLRYLQEDKLISSYGIYQIYEDKHIYDVKSVAIFGNDKDHFLFEEGHWWITQITYFADSWLKRQFGLGDHFDFTKYRTNLTAAGTKIEDLPIQECDTISRLIYGLSSAYMLTGHDRYLDAVKNGVEYQRRYFRTYSHDGEFCIWQHAINHGKKILLSDFSDDQNSIPLYEQIYAIAGMAQYFKVTYDWEALDDILKTVEFFLRFYKDGDYYADKSKGGFFSHLDWVTQSPHADYLGDNKSKKNWNSVGDHTPAYLLNLLLAIENIGDIALEKRYQDLYKLQVQLADIIIEKFPDPTSPYVNERFYADWTPDHEYKWQQDRAVVGHNLKIAWNLTRVYHMTGDQKYLDTAMNIADKMPDNGMDMIRGGWYDVVERHPKNGMPLDFAWHNRKAWWQQEQAILAYLILAGTVKDNSEKKAQYLSLARESIAFWNLSFLDHDYGETYFDVLDNGTPYLVEDRAQAASHSKSGYHSMELNFLTHIYYRFLLCDKHLFLNFCLAENRTIEKLNVLPDFLARDRVQIEGVWVNGQKHNNYDRELFQVDVSGQDYSRKEIKVTVQLQVKDGIK